MKKRIKGVRAACGLALLIGFQSCDDFLDINTDPNNPLKSTPALVLPTAQTVIFEALGNGSGGISDLTSQFVNQTVQRGPTNFYFVGGDEFSLSNAWQNLYAGALKDLDYIIEVSTEQESWHYLGVAQTLKAYTYSMLVDLWGKAVYSEFGKGTENPFASFNDGREVYQNVLLLLNEAAHNLAMDATVSPGTDDLVYKDIGQWIKFNNSLKLKLYNQVRLTDLYDADDVDALIEADVMMAEVEDGFRLKYNASNNPENRHPLYNQDYVQANANYIDPYFYLTMAGLSSPSVPNSPLGAITDPRIPYYFYNQIETAEAPQNPPTSARFGPFLSIWFASFNIDPNEGFDQSVSQTKVGLYPAGGAFDDGSAVMAGVAANQNPGHNGEGYTRLYPYFAHLYTRAELSLTMGAAGDPRSLFEEAMYASFDEVNEIASDAGVPEIDEAAIDSYTGSVMGLFDGATDEEKLELIITEKWIATFGFTVDAYTDYRRTGYPVLFNPATDGNPFTILNRSYPVSLPYYIGDLQINPNADAQRNPGSERVFWDVN
ncbi:MAG: SusD/RagB family nutrient-binding outer membrane lipoprotein [Bacteroidota bacterium]|nr:SusD/RagB family nutrient-binding outer membrane lipoprotein [Bacteroidota bacterium]